ncbi:MAG: NAD(P)H-dependent oxidoreductase subunit E, partial [Rhodoferax sp.]|nr:NAD(P)H-dependent oxidoreductase subunit E [Rhodoferax sp.]
MDPVTVPLAEADPVVLATPDQLRRSARRVSQLKGRQVDDVALQELRSLVGAPPPGGHRRDLLIEHLHVLNDHYHGLFERHLVALASDMKLSMAEVYEVASFYHHFEVMSDGQTPAVLTVRVCDSLSCAMAGSAELMARLPALLGDTVRVMAAPCLGRCEQAPAVLVGQRAVPHADVSLVLEAANEASKFITNKALAAVQSAQVATDFIAFQAYRQQGGYALAAAVVNGEEPAEGVIRAMEDSGLRGLGG